MFTGYEKLQQGAMLLMVTPDCSVRFVCLDPLPVDCGCQGQQITVERIRSKANDQLRNWNSPLGMYADYCALETQNNDARPWLASNSKGGGLITQGLPIRFLHVSLLKRHWLGRQRETTSRNPHPQKKLRALSLVSATLEIEYATQP